MRSIAWSLLAAASVNAQSILENLSFGHKEGSFQPSHQTVENWHISGEQHTPDVLSDRIILTPPYPGNKRGAIWSKSSMDNSEWSASLEFRVNGQERSSGNMQIWYAKQGNSQVGTNSLYTVDKFDGLLLVVDQYGGRGGTIRGFLNDGTKSFRANHNVDGLSFGQCDYRYRNRGVFSVVTLKQTVNAFEVSVDNQPCFKSEQVILPRGYEFGITAGSAEVPDSFELKQFTVGTVPAGQQGSRENYQQVQQQNQQYQQNQQQAMGGQQGGSFPPATGGSQDMAELRSQVDALRQQINILTNELREMTKKQADNHVEIMNKAIPLQQTSGRIEDRVNDIKRDIESKDYKDLLNNLQQAVTRSHSNMMETLPLTMDHLITKNGPRLSNFVFIIIAVQIMLIGGYIAYKRRMKSQPKKYL